VTGSSTQKFIRQQVNSMRVGVGTSNGGPVRSRFSTRREVSDLFESLMTRSKPSCLAENGQRAMDQELMLNPPTIAQLVNTRPHFVESDIGSVMDQEDDILDHSSAKVDANRASDDEDNDWGESSDTSSFAPSTSLDFPFVENDIESVVDSVRNQQLLQNPPTAAELTSPRPIFVDDDNESILNYAYSTTSAEDIASSSSHESFADEDTTLPQESQLPRHVPRHWIRQGIFKAIFSERRYSHKLPFRLCRLVSHRARCYHRPAFFQSRVAVH
jgi:hypothetical protein